MKMTTVYTQSKNCWAIECDCAQAGVDASKFIRACRTHLNRDTFPTALWYHDRGSDGSPHQRVECYGPNAKRDARDAAIIRRFPAGVIPETPALRNPNGARRWRYDVLSRHQGREPF